MMVTVGQLWDEDWQGKPEYSEKTYPSATLSTTYRTWPYPASNTGRRGGKPATTCLSDGAALPPPCCMSASPHNFLVFCVVLVISGRLMGPPCCRSAGQSVKLLLTLVNTVVLSFESCRDTWSSSLFFLDMYVFRRGDSSSTRGGVWLLLVTPFYGALTL
jgi:hypothetical protein